MSETIDRYFDELDARIKDLHSKMNDSERQLKNLQISAKSKSDKAKQEIQTHMNALESKAKETRALASTAEAKMKAWIEEQKTTTRDKIDGWKAQGDRKKLALRAQWTQDYAVAAMQFAASAFGEAGRAAGEAIVARIDAEAAGAP